MNGALRLARTLRTMFRPPLPCTIDMKQLAITENHLYSKAYSRGKKYIGRNVVIYVLNDYKAEKIRRANPMKQRLNRVGLTVTKKLGGAVVRSRVKRVLREAYRLTEKEYGVRRGFLVVIVARETAVKAKMQDIRTDLVNGFTKLGMLQQPLTDNEPRKA